MTSEEYIGRRAPRWYIVLLRLFMAGCFIYVGVCGVIEWRKSNSLFTDRFDKFAAADTQIGWFRSYLNTVVEPIKGNIVFTILLLAAPLLLGLSLLLGLLTPLSTFLGVLFVLHYLCIKFYHALDGGGVYEYQLMLHVMQIAVLAVLFFAGAGRTFGIDGIFWRNRVRLKFEPEVPEELRAASPRGKPRGPVSTEPESIPLSEPGAVTIEETVGEFSAVLEPEEPPEVITGKTEAKPEGEQTDEQKGEGTPGVG